MREKKILGRDLSAFNLCEELIMDEIEQFLIEDTDFCRCVVCVEDIFALALNKTPAKYIQDDYSSHDLKKMIDREQIKKAVLDAVSQVRKNPHHGKT